jgi:hypothetical protein
MMRKLFIIFSVLVSSIVTLLFAISAIESTNRIILIINLMLAGSMALSGVFFYRALEQLSAEGHDNFWHVVLWSKLFAGQDNFTETGWRYWNWLRLTIAGFCILFLFRSIAEYMAIGIR